MLYLFTIKTGRKKTESSWVDSKLPTDIESYRVRRKRNMKALQPGLFSR